MKKIILLASFLAILGVTAMAVNVRRGEFIDAGINLTNNLGHSIPDNDSSDGTFSYAFVSRLVIRQQFMNQTVNGSTTTINQSTVAMKFIPEQWDETQNGTIASGQTVRVPVQFRIPIEAPYGRYVFVANLVEIPFLFNQTTQQWDGLDPVIADTSLVNFTVISQIPRPEQPQNLFQRIFNSIHNFLCNNFGLC